METANDFYTLAQNRRSTRKFTSEQLKPDLIEKILSAAFFSPSAKNLRPVYYSVVQNAELLKKLSEAKVNGADFLASAPCGFVISGDAETSDMWIEDCSLAASAVLYACEQEGLGACWIQIRGRTKQDGSSSSAYIKQILNLDSRLEVLCIIAVGYKVSVKNPHQASEYDTGRITFYTKAV